MVEFKNVKRNKSLGKMSGDSIGISTMVNAEVLSAEYAKNKEGKVIASKAGNKLVALNCKVETEITKQDGAKVTIPNFFNVKYYETDYSPKLKEVNPTKELKKYVQVKFNTGGLDTFGSLKVENYVSTKDNINRTKTEIYGGNIQKAIKKNGEYVTKDFNGNDVTFIKDNKFKVSLKGFIQRITDTESFIKNNYNKISKTLYFNMYYLENDNEYDIVMPCIMENVEENTVMDIVKYIKDTANNVIGVKGSIESRAVYIENVKSDENKKSKFGEYEFTGTSEKNGYKGYLVIDYDEKKENWVIIKTNNTGELILNKTEKTVVADDDFPF